MRNTIVFFLPLAACSDESLFICTDLQGQAAVDCVVAALNKEAKSTQLLDDGTMTLKWEKTGGEIDVSYVDSIGVDPGGVVKIDDVSATDRSELGFEGTIPGAQEIVLSRKAEQIAPVILHEIGHAYGLQFPDNPSDPAHSHDQNAIMFRECQPYLTTELLRLFVAEVRRQGKLQ